MNNSLVPAGETTSRASQALAKYKSEVVDYMAQLEQKGKDLSNKADKVDVQEANSYRGAQALLRDIKSLAKSAEDIRESAVKPFRDVSSAINAAANKGVRDVLAPAEAELKRQMSNWLDAEEARRYQERLEQQAKNEESANKAREEIKSEGIFVPVVYAPQNPVDQGEGISSSRVVKFEVTDKSLLKPEYIVEDSKRLRKVVMALEERAVNEVSENKDNPAIRVWRERQISSRIT